MIKLIIGAAAGIFAMVLMMILTVAKRGDRKIGITEFDELEVYLSENEEKHKS